MNHLVATSAAEVRCLWLWVHDSCGLSFKSP